MSLDLREIRIIRRLGPNAPPKNGWEEPSSEFDGIV
jgi:hypothetical protein